MGAKGAHLTSTPNFSTYNSYILVKVFSKLEYVIGGSKFNAFENFFKYNIFPPFKLYLMPIKQVKGNNRGQSFQYFLNLSSIAYNILLKSQINFIFIES